MRDGPGMEVVPIPSLPLPVGRTQRVAIKNCSPVNWEGKLWIWGDSYPSLPQIFYILLGFSRGTESIAYIEGEGERDQ